MRIEDFLDQAQIKMKTEDFLDPTQLWIKRESSINQQCLSRID